MVSVTGITLCLYMCHFLLQSMTTPLIKLQAQHHRSLQAKNLQCIQKVQQLCCPLILISFFDHWLGLACDITTLIWIKRQWHPHFISATPPSRAFQLLTTVFKNKLKVSSTDNKISQDGSFSHTLPTTSKGSIMLELLDYKFTNIQNFTLQNSTLRGHTF